MPRSSFTTRPATAAAAMLAASLALAGCGDREADQRKAFVAFLRTRIIDKPGLHVPQPTPDESKAFGPYADQYAIITTFHRVLNESVSPRLASAVAAGAVQSIGELVTRRGDIATAKASVDGIAAALDGDLAQADAAHRNLRQPDDVRIAYDQAYARVVTAVASTVAAIVPVTDRAFAAALDLGDYLQRHKGQVVVSGPTLQARDASTLATVNAKLRSLQASQGDMQAAQARMRTLVTGAGG